MIIYRFQCHSPKSSHSPPLPQSPKDCSIHLCLFCCLAYSVIVTIFLTSIYMCVSILYWCFSFWLTSLCIIGSSFIHLIRTDSNVFFLMAWEHVLKQQFTKEDIQRVNTLLKRNSTTLISNQSVSSIAQSCLTHCDPMECSTPGFPDHHQLQSLLKLMSIEPSNHLILCCPPLLPPSVFPSIRVFSNESVLHIRWPKYWSFSFSISPSNEYSGLVFLRIDWLDLLAVQGTLKSLLQHHSSKASILRCSAFFRVQLSHPYMTTGETIALTRWTFVGKVMSLLLNMLSRLVIAFLPRSKCLLISWL